jgi:hypothetical protein
MKRSIHHAPIIPHIEVMAVAPESMIHLNAMHGGVATIKGDIKNPFRV